MIDLQSDVTTKLFKLMTYDKHDFDFVVARNRDMVNRGRHLTFSELIRLLPDSSQADKDELVSVRIKRKIDEKIIELFDAEIAYKNVLTQNYSEARAHINPVVIVEDFYFTLGDTNTLSRLMNTLVSVLSKLITQSMYGTALAKFNKRNDPEGIRHQITAFPRLFMHPKLKKLIDSYNTDINNSTVASDHPRLNHRIYIVFACKGHDDREIFDPFQSGYVLFMKPDRMTHIYPYQFTLVRPCRILGVVNLKGNKNATIQ